MAWSLQPEGAIDFVNQRWVDYTGLSLEEAIAEQTRPMHPEDLPRAMAEWRPNLAAEKPFEDEMRLRRADGEYRWFLIRTDPLRDEQGNLVKWYGVSIDIEDRKRAEEALKESQRKLEEAQRIAHVGHWDRDLETGRIMWSDEMYRILGLPLEERDSPRTEWLDVAHPEDRQRLSLALEEMQRGIRRFDVEFRIVRPNGEVRFLHSQGDVIRDERGRPLRRFGTAQDITERKLAEEQLKATSEQLRALSARVQSAREEEGTRIAREIHDELGSMLTGLKWDLEEISRMLSTQPGQSQLAVMREKLSALTKLTDMSVSTLRRIASELRPSMLDDLGLGAAIEWQTQQFQGRTGIICHCDCSLEDIELSQEQSTAVFRIFQEALTNVLRHAQATRVDITIKNGAGYFILVVGDNGKGITQKEKSEQRSLGILGMRERAHLVGAEIDIKGLEGKGTVVTVRVPTSGPGRF
jgi:PAS domain S-box-containing protein